MTLSTLVLIHLSPLVWRQTARINSNGTLVWSKAKPGHWMHSSWRHCYYASSMYAHLQVSITFQLATLWYWVRLRQVWHASWAQLHSKTRCKRRLTSSLCRGRPGAVAVRKVLLSWMHGPFLQKKWARKCPFTLWEAGILKWTLPPSLLSMMSEFMLVLCKHNSRFYLIPKSLSLTTFRFQNKCSEYDKNSSSFCSPTDNWSTVYADIDMEKSTAAVRSHICNNGPFNTCRRVLLYASKIILFNTLIRRIVVLFVFKSVGQSVYTWKRQER